MKISVALCTFNGEQYLDQQLKSIVTQTLSIDEIIICDDNSIDNTSKILNIYKDKYPQLIFLYYNKVTIGTIKNFEQAISLTTGDIVFTADQDDIWYPDKIKKMISTFNEHANTLLLFSNGDLIDENGIGIGLTLWDKWSFTADMRKKWVNNKLAFKDLLKNNNRVTGATVTFKKELKKHILPIQVPIGYWHDAWFALNASALNGLFFIEESLIQYRIHSSQQVGIPESIRRPNNVSNFNDSISFDNFYRLIGNRYPELFNNFWLFIFSRKCLRFIKKLSNYLKKYFNIFNKF
jgi:glycosyltransferase involved in cell wall biosynthesis